LRIAGYVDSIADGVVVQKQHGQMAHSQLAPSWCARVCIKAKQDRIPEAWHQQKASAEGARAKTTGVAPKVRGNEPPASLPGHWRDRV
jgi:hypothetical protein